MHTKNLSYLKHPSGVASGSRNAAPNFLPVYSCGFSSLSQLVLLPGTWPPTPLHKISIYEESHCASKSPQMEISYHVSFPFQRSIFLIWWVSGWSTQHTSKHSLFGKNTKCFTALFPVSPWAGLVISNNWDNILHSLNISNLIALPILPNWKANKWWRRELVYFFCFQVKWELRNYCLMLPVCG